MQLVWPSTHTLSSCARALERGWSPNNLRAEAGQEELALIHADPAAFVVSLVDVQGTGAPVRMPSGVLVARLPDYLLDNDGDALVNAWEDAVGRGPGWTRRLLAGWRALERAQPTMDFTERLRQALLTRDARRDAQ